ncbi:MAG TPA: Ig-like domain-containing protein [Candidatus Dormibacteraeota bacterium]|nr:Ig-like domain-containing protein [Candidatus Dormibacteraeota bacterium]
MITEDPQLETRLRHYGSVLRSGTQVSSGLHAQIIERLDRRQPARPHRLAMQLALTAAMLLVAVGGVVLVQRVRADELAKAEPRVSLVSPADGATDVPINGEFRVTFARRPATLPELTHSPADGSQAAPRWDGSTLVVGYTGLHTRQRYQVVLLSDYTSGFGGKGQVEKRWSFVTELGPPAAGIPLIWYSTASPYGAKPQAGPWFALDWNGTVVGKLNPSGGINQSPDGSRLDMAGVGYADQAGQPVAAVRLNNKGGPGWSDDSRHFCLVGTASGAVPAGNYEPAWLFAGPIEGPLRRVAQFGQFGGQVGAGPIACSFQNDRAVVVQTVIMGASDVWVFKLSTGALLYHRQYSNQQTPFIRASHDGQYLAEQTAAASNGAGPQGFGATVIRRVSDGHEVARLDNQTVVAFSWDGSRVVTMPAIGTSAPNEARLVDWQSGKVLWRLPGPTTAGTAVYALPHPNGADLVVGIGPQSADGIDELWLVDANGTARRIAKGPLWISF